MGYYLTSLLIYKRNLFLAKNHQRSCGFLVVRSHDNFTAAGKGPVRWTLPALATDFRSVDKLVLSTDLTLGIEEYFHELLELLHMEGFRDTRDSIVALDYRQNATSPRSCFKEP